jgi:hypothetical protein
METITQRAGFWNHLGRQKENKAYKEFSKHGVAIIVPV